MAAASGEAQIPPTSLSVDVSIENAAVGGLKESLAKASEFELRLRKLPSDAEMIKTKMHVSTYVSPPPSGCPNNSISELFFVDFQWGHYLVHPLGVAPKAPSNFF